MISYSFLVASICIVAPTTVKDDSSAIKIDKHAQRAIQAIVRCGGRCNTRTIKGQTHFVECILQGRRVTEDTMRAISSFRALEELDCSESVFIDHAFRTFKCPPSLRCLRLTSAIGLSDHC